MIVFHSRLFDATLASDSVVKLSNPARRAIAFERRPAQMRELFQLWSASLTEKQIDDIIHAATCQPEQGATIFASSEIVAETRVSTIRWLTEQWVKEFAMALCQKGKL